MLILLPKFPPQWPLETKGISCDKEAMTKPSLFWMTTPRPALLSLSKIASSKFILEQGDLRAVHEGTCQVGCTCVIVGRVENSSIHSFICSNNWPRVIVCLPNQRLNHIVLYLRVSWFPIGIVFQKTANFGKRKRAWTTSSWWLQIALWELIFYS